jgi:hypothetical protein
MAMVLLKGLGKLKKFNDLIETRNRNLPICSASNIYATDMDK